MTSKSESIKSPRGQRENFLGIALLFLAMFAIWMASLVGLSAYFDGKDDEYSARGTFGDMFGAINSLFTGLTLVGVFYTIYLQRKELALTKDEFEKQKDTTKKERFETTFFNLLNLHHEIIANFYFERRIEGEELIKLEKREVFRYAVKDLVKFLGYRRPTAKYQIVERPAATMDENKKTLNEGYILFNRHYSETLSYYFQNLYQIFKFIYLSELTVKEKQFYASLVRAQLSYTELYLLFYNSMIGGLGRPKFLFLMKEFDLLQNFDFQNLVYLTIDKPIYDDLVNHIADPFLN